MAENCLLLSCDAAHSFQLNKRLLTESLCGAFAIQVPVSVATIERITLEQEH